MSLAVLGALLGCVVRLGPSVPEVWGPVSAIVVAADDAPIATDVRVRAVYRGGAEPDMVGLDGMLHVSGCTEVPFSADLQERSPATGAAHHVRAWSAGCLDGHGPDDRVVAEVFYVGSDAVLELAILTEG